MWALANQNKLSIYEKVDSTDWLLRSKIPKGTSIEDSLKLLFDWLLQSSGEKIFFYDKKKYHSDPITSGCSVLFNSYILFIAVADFWYILCGFCGFLVICYELRKNVKIPSLQQ